MATSKKLLKLNQKCLNCGQGLQTLGKAGACYGVFAPPALLNCGEIMADQKTEIAFKIARDFKDGSVTPILANMEWQESLIKLQSRLHRRTIMLSIIVSSFLSLVGVLIGVLLGEYIKETQAPPQIELSGKQQQPGNKWHPSILGDVQTIPQFLQPGLTSSAKPVLRETE